MPRRRTIHLGLLVALVACVVGALGAAAGQASVTYEASFGGSGSEAGRFTPNELGPGGVAVDQSNGNVWVADPGQNRVEKFDAAGAFILMFGQGVDQTTGGNVCTAVSGHTCQAGSTGGSAGSLRHPQGVGVDSDTGDVYVQDAGNNRVDKFDAGGTFILTWGKGVDSTTGADICTASSGDTCKAGGTSGSTETTPPTPSAKGEFAGWESRTGPGLAVDEDGYVYVTDPQAVPYPRIQKFDSDGNFVGQIGPSNVNFYDRGLSGYLNGIAVAPDGDVFVLEERIIKQFHGDEFSQDGLSARYQQTYEPPSQFFGGVRQLAIDPSNGFILIGSQSENPCPDGTSGSYRIDEYHPSGQQIDCTVVQSPSISNGNVEAGMAVSLSHKLYVGDRSSDMIRIFNSPAASTPEVVEERSREITSRTVTLEAEIAANLGDTTYHVEYGASPCSSSSCQSTPESSSIGAAIAPVSVTTRLEDLTPETVYYYRFVATNSAGTSPGPDQRFATFASPSVDNSCENNLARQQTRSSLLLDCRAYELVSAEDTGGYNVESDLVPGQDPFGGYPMANGRALYAVHDGGIPGTGHPTNNGPDPYVATRDAAAGRWVTKYVGVPANAPSLPFRSEVAGADEGLSTFAFGGPDICDPCFEDGSAGIPVRTPAGDLVQGMEGSIPVPKPEPAGTVAKPVSGDGGTFVFGSTQQFEGAGNSSGSDVTYYARPLAGGPTEVVSTLPDGSTIAAGDEVEELDVSRDGSRVLIGEVVGTDGSGSDLWHLYLHQRGNSHSIDITPGASSGVLFDGMTSDGSQVYFTTTDALVSDSDTSADIYRVAVSGTSASLSRVTTGTGGAGDTDSCDPAGNSYNPENWNVAPEGPTDCSAVAIGGGGGVGPGSGVIYFLSPERLDGNGQAGAPNLFRAAPGSQPQFVATLESSANAPLGEAAHVHQKSIGSFSNPEGTAIDPVDGSMYVFDTDETVQSPGAYVQKFDASGSVDSTFGSGGKLNGSNTTKGEFLELGNGAAVGLTMGIPISIAVDTDPSSANYRDLYVADLTHQVVDRFDHEGNFLGEFAVNYPSGIAVNPSNGNVYVASIFGNVTAYQPNGTPVAPEFAIPFFSTADLAVDSGGNVYVTDGSKTTKYDASGVELEVLDSNASYGVAVDPTDDHVYVDEGDRVVEYDPSGDQVGGAIGAGVVEGMASLSVQDGRMLVGSPGTGKADEFSSPITPPDRAYDSPLVIDGAREPAVRHTADFETNTSGADAVFPSTMPLTGFDSAAHYNLFRYDAAGADVQCVSCSPTLATPTSDASLPSNGLGLTDDGRVFFTSGEGLVLRDNNELKDPYEWEQGKAELISTGKSQYDSGLLTATADGTDALFFTRETLTGSDHNGPLMKLYDAREGGGFLVIPQPPPCAASDECHGPASQAPPPANLGTLKGEGRNGPGAAGCNRAKLAHAARRLAVRAKELRGQASRASGRSAAKLRHKAIEASRAARRSKARLKQCGRATGGKK